MITFDNTEFNLGNIKYGENKTVDVSITNSSSSPVSFFVTNASCSCTQGSLEYSTLQPQKNGLFKISFNTTKAGRGANQSKSITLNYNINNQNFSQVFRLKANVI